MSRIKPTLQSSPLTNTREIWHGHASHTLIKIKLKMREQSYVCIRGHIGRKNNTFEFWTQHYLGSKVYHFICSTLNALSHGRSFLALYDMERLEEVVLS